MGQQNSHPKPQPIPVPQRRTATPEPADPEEAAKLREEREKAQAEERARRAEAAEQRLAVRAQQNKKMGAKLSGGTGMSNGGTGGGGKKETPLEQASREERGWRAADEQAELRAYN